MDFTLPDLPLPLEQIVADCRAALRYRANCRAALRQKIYGSRAALRYRADCRAALRKKVCISRRSFKVQSRLQSRFRVESKSLQRSFKVQSRLQSSFKVQSKLQCSEFFAFFARNFCISDFAKISHFFREKISSFHWKPQCRVENIRAPLR